uniref:Uncharacterized protein n=1 Tax=Anguilla anguilla TaxID=7936 RepID=A0A0E9Q0L4_ANGAN
MEWVVMVYPLCSDSYPLPPSVIAKPLVNNSCPLGYITLARPTIRGGDLQG